jgi:hypothetical protein
MSNRRVHEHSTYMGDSPLTSSTPSPIVCSQSRQSNGLNPTAANQSNLNSNQNLCAHANNPGNLTYENIIANGAAILDANPNLEQFGAYSVVQVVPSNANSLASHLSQGNAGLRGVGMKIKREGDYLVLGAFVSQVLVVRIKKTQKQIEGLKRLFFFNCSAGRWRQREQPDRSVPEHSEFNEQ